MGIPFMRPAFVLLLVVLPAAAREEGKDPLPSWNEGPSKQAILDFVARVVDKRSPDFVPMEERIAVFDNDGTLWSEQPMYFQFAFAVDRIKALADRHPEWKEKEPFKSVLKGDVKAALAGGERSVAELMAASHAGMTTEEFDAIAKEWLAAARHPRFKRPYSELVYQPMLEVLSFLRSSGFTTFIASGGGADFIRAFAERVYGIPPQQVVGSTGKLKFEMREGRPVLLKLPEIDFVDDGPGKPAGIHKFIGRRPIMAFGNSDGDLQMLQWTTAGHGPRLGLIVRHTDGDREWAYDRESSIGRLKKALDEAPKSGWIVTDMKKEWKVIYPFQK